MLMMALTMPKVVGLGEKLGDDDGRTAQHTTHTHRAGDVCLNGIGPSVARCHGEAFVCNYINNISEMCFEVWLVGNCANGQQTFQSTESLNEKNEL